VRAGRKERVVDREGNGYALRDEWHRPTEAEHRALPAVLQRAPPARNVDEREAARFARGSGSPTR
jgi:hypothetical protein